MYVVIAAQSVALSLCKHHGMRFNRFRLLFTSLIMRDRKSVVWGKSGDRGGSVSSTQKHRYVAVDPNWTSEPSYVYGRV